MTNSEFYLGLVTHYSDMLIFPVFALFISLGLTKLCIHLLPLLGFVDKARGRHIHKGVIPRGGGLAIIVSFLVTFGLYVLLCRGGETAVEHWLQIFYPSLLLVPLGIIDDRFELKAVLKLIVQALVVLVIWFLFKPVYSIGSWVLPTPLAFAVLFVWVIIIINAFNLIDGMDGLAAGLSVVSAICLAGWFFFSGNTVWMVGLLIFAGSCLGFLRYNFHPAKIFMGDVGSTFLGLVFAVAGLASCEQTVTITALLLPALLFGLPLFDVALAIWRRTARKALNPASGGIMDGDQDHLHHRLLRQYKQQGSTAWIMYLLGCFFAVTALVLLIFRNTLPGLAYLVLVVAVLIIFRRLAEIELLDSAKLLQHGFSLPRKNLSLNMAHPVIDFFMISAAYLITEQVLSGLKDVNLESFIIAVFPICMVLLGTRVYRIYWLRSGLRSQVTFGTKLFLGCLLSLCLSYYFSCSLEKIPKTLAESCFFPAYALLFPLLCFAFILLERFLIHYAEGFWLQRLYLDNQCRQSGHAVFRSLIYGGGLFSRLYITYNFNAGKSFSGAVEEVVGIVDDDPALNGLYVNGFKILGDYQDLEKIYAKTPFDRIVLTVPDLTPDKRIAVENFCRKQRVALLTWSVRKTPVPGFEFSEEEEKNSSFRG